MIFMIPCPALNNPSPLDPALYTPCPQLHLIPLPALYNLLPVSNDAPKVPSNIDIIGKAPPLLMSFFNVLITPFIKTLKSSQAFTISVISSKSSLEDFTVFVP